MYFGKVLSVDTRNLAEATLVDHAIGATTILVTDASTYDERGGTVIIDGTGYPYLSTDVEADSILIVGGLAAAVPAESLVEVFPPTPEKVATVDIGGDGDAIPVTVPLALVEALPDGVREPADQETVTVSADLTITDVIGRELPKGAISADRLSLGVVQNLVLDPQFHTALHATGAPWAIEGPDPVHPEFNYLRCTNGVGGDVSVYLTEPAPVEEGATVSFAAMVRAGAANVSDALAGYGAGYGGGYGTTTTTTPGSGTQGLAAIRLRVEFIAGDGTVLSDATHIREVLTSELTAETWTPVSALFTTPTGYVSFQAKVETSGQVDGHIDFLKPVVTVLTNQVSSVNYSPGESGWSFSDETSQVEDLNVLGSMGADRITANELSLGELEVGDFLDSLPRGIIAYGRSYGTNTDEIGSTKTTTHELVGGSLKFGRAYRVEAHGTVESDTAGNAFVTSVNYFCDGSDNGILDASQGLVNVNVNVGTNLWRGEFFCSAIYLPQNDYETTRFLFGLDRVQGTGTGHLLLTDVNRAFEFSIHDLGRTDATPANGNNGRLTQRSKALAGEDEPDPLVSYTKSFRPVWSQAYNGDRQKRNTPAEKDLFQGYLSATRGRTRSLFGFDHAAIRSFLTGAEPTKITLKFRVREASRAEGMTAYLSSHNYSALPATWSPTNVRESRANWSGCKEGLSYTKTLPLALASELQSGATTGFGFGPGPSNSSLYYGRMYGDGSTSEPVLTITCLK